MQRQRFYRPITVAILSLAFCLLAAALLMSARANEGTNQSAGLVLPDTSRPRSDAGVNGTLLPNSTAAYNGVITPSTTIYAPWLLGGTSVVRVYNTGSSPATVQATFTYSGGTTTANKMLPAGAVGDIDLSGVLTGTEFSAILTGTQPIVAVINDFGPEGKQASSYAAMPASLGQTKLALPDIFYKDGGGWDSKPVIQNVGAAPTPVTIVYTRTVEPFTTTNWTDASVTNLAPGQVHVFDPGDANLPDNFAGIATVRADQPVLAVVRNAAVEIGEVYPRQVYVYRASLPTPGSGPYPLYFPMLVHVVEEIWAHSQIQFMNARGSSTPFTLEIDGTSSGESIDAWLTQVYWQGDQAQGWQGAGRVPSTQYLHSLVWLTGDLNGDFLAAYTAPSVGAQTWYLPYTDQSESLATYVAVQNLDTNNDAQITLTYHNMTGTLTPAPQSPIAPLGMELYPTSPGFVGGVVVQADRPVVAVAAIAGRLVLDKEIYLPVVTKNN